MYFMGVDVGGSKTDLVLVDHSGTVISHLRAPGANYQGVGVEKAFEILSDAINKLMKEAGLKKQEITFAYFGVAGADMEYEIKIVRSILERLGLENYDFDNDGRIALRSGTLDDIGILISCGTGGITYGCDGREMIRKGGFSRFFGERLGSYIIAGMVASAIVRSKDGRDEHTIMQELFESKIGQSIEEIMYHEYMGEDRSKMAEYMILLFQSLYEAAHNYDYVALRILGQIVEEVLKIVNIYEKELDLTPPIKVVLEGSFFKKADKILIRMIESALGKEHQVIVPVQPPVFGAILLAAEKAGYSFQKDALENLLKHWSDEK
ncbi:N-acetylglucosamine kinase [Pseudothermotoga sp. U03pept]|uniref:N-acetylglucosamine kinase n=1 Tax=Pseudothermotoga sp. U03pept TaxID=3447012 RepID=UPI003F122019